ncbi:MAG: flagellar hook protein FlgE [Pseudomonadales bacterium]|nr:flagellar hook protein FlgE [Pseudomonadales bacterium]
MSFNSALSGLRAASSDLSVVGNNIANASTVGFKSSRAEFADVYANSQIGSGSNAIGSGVVVADVAQQFTQGSVNFTGNALDLAVNGNGFFVFSNAGAVSYSRSGALGQDKNGFIVNDVSAKLQGFTVNASGDVSGSLSDIQISTANQAPQASAGLTSQVNLDATATAILQAVRPFDATDQSTYHSATSLAVYDSLGNSHVLTEYFVKRAQNDWDMIIQIDGADIGAAGAEEIVNITFNTDGTIQGPLTPVTLGNWAPGTGALTPSSFTVNLQGTSQFGSPFSVNDLSQDGFTTGRLVGLDVADGGSLFARYTNGQSTVLAVIGLANFNNPQGLSQSGGTAWRETFDSGPAIVGAPGTSSLGVVQSGALEDSNVEISEELVRLIIAQRNYQANAKTIEAENAVTQAILNLR